MMRLPHHHLNRTRASVDLDSPLTWIVVGMLGAPIVLAFTVRLMVWMFL